MARLPIATRESIPDDQRALFDEMVQALGSVPRYGPGSVMMHVPKAQQWATRLNHYLREESSLPKKIQELAMLLRHGNWIASTSGTRMRRQRARRVCAMRPLTPCGTAKISPVCLPTRRLWCTMARNSSARIT